MGISTVLLTGHMCRSEWVREVGERVGNIPAALEAFDDTGVVDEAMLSEVDTLRAGGVTVAILTNGTGAIPAEVDAIGIRPRVDAIFNSAEWGVAKPDRRVFELVSSQLRVRPSEVFFTDDSVAKLAGAIELGMTARHFVGIHAFVDHFREAGLRR